MQYKDKKRGRKTQDNGTNPVLLSRTELYWLLGKTKVSKIFEYQIRSRIKGKVQTLMELELPLLVKSNFIDNGLGRDLETGPIIMTQALVRQRSRVQIPAKASFFLEKEQEMKTLMILRPYQIR